MNAFERFVIEHLQTANRLLAEGYPQPYSAKLAEKFESEAEYWRSGEILSLDSRIRDHATNDLATLVAALRWPRSSK